MDSADLRRKRSGVLFLAGRARIPSPLSSSQAILDAVARFGYEFRKRRQNERKLDIAIHGVPYVIDILQWFPFTTERKRTTVVVRFRQQLFLFCKVFVAVDSSAGSRLRRPSPSGTGGARQRVRWSFHRPQQSSSVSNARLRWKASFRDGVRELGANASQRRLLRFLCSRIAAASAGSRPATRRRHRHPGRSCRRRFHFHSEAAGGGDSLLDSDGRQGGHGGGDRLRGRCGSSNATSRATDREESAGGRIACLCITGDAGEPFRRGFIFGVGG